MATVEGRSYEQVDLPETPGDLASLDNVTEGIDHWLGVILTRIEPVLRPMQDSPEKAMAEIRAPQSPLADRIQRLQRLQSRLAETADRISL